MKLAFENCEFIGLESLAVSTCMLWSGETPIQGYIVHIDVEASLCDWLLYKLTTLIHTNWIVYGITSEVLPNQT